MVLPTVPRAECRKTCGRGPKVTEIFGTGCSTLRLARSEGI
jgi:hypothetical protein